MTREDKIKIYMFNNKRILAELLVDNDFESRTCENCKWYDGSHSCKNGNSIAHNTDNRVYPDDGCKTEWEAKNKHNAQHGDRLDKVYYGNNE